MPLTLKRIAIVFPRQLVRVLLGNFLFNLNSSSGFATLSLCPLKCLSICQDLRLGLHPLVGFVFANNLGHIVRNKCRQWEHTIGTILGNFAGSAKLFFLLSHVAQHFGSHTAGNLIFILRFLSFFHFHFHFIIFFCFSPWLLKCRCEWSVLFFFLLLLGMRRDLVPIICFLPKIICTALHYFGLICRVE